MPPEHWTQMKAGLIRQRPLVQAIALALSLSISAAQAETIHVKTNSDTSGSCRLRDAIASANTDTGVNDCVAGNGADIINLSNINSSNVTLSNGQLLITSDITIQGHDVELDGGSATRLIEEYGGRLTVSNLRFQYGDAGVSDGGAILAKSNSVVRISNSSFANNTATSGGSVSSVTGSIVYLDTVSITGGEAVRGGAVRIRNGQVIINDSTISGNMSEGAGSGGAFYMSEPGSILFLGNSTISGNTVVGGPARGGAIFNSKGRLFLNRTTISNNTGNTGGVFLSYGFMDITSSIIAGNGNTDCTEVRYGNVSRVTRNGRNLVESGTSCATFDFTADPGLGPLVNNGGPTSTHALPGDSVALNKATGCSAGTKDQRGVARTEGDCDLGSYEFEFASQAGPNFVVTRRGDVDHGACDLPPGHCSLREAINASNSDLDESEVTFDPDLFTPTAHRIFLGGTRLPKITSIVTIQGEGVTIDGDKKSGIFYVGEQYLTNSASLTIDSVTLLNGTGFGGSAIRIWSADLMVSNSTLSANVSNNGGAINAYNSNVNLSNTTISGNTAGKGGGMSMIFTTAGLVNSTLSGNVANKGGAIETEHSEINILNSTLTNNSASFASNFYLGSRGSVNLSNSILFDSTGANVCEGPDSDYNYNSFSASNSLTGTFGNCGTRRFNEINGDPLLGPLADNGGPAKTHLPAANSPVINAGDNTVLPVDLLTDQRGSSYPRIHANNVDLGSIELQYILFSDSFEQQD